MNTAVGVQFFSVSTYTQWMSVSTVCLYVCVCAADVNHGPQEIPCFASPHKLHINRVVRQPLTSSDSGEPHRREEADPDSHPDRVLLPWIQNSQAWLRRAQPGSNLLNVNCNHAWVGRLVGSHTYTHMHAHTHTHTSCW